MKKWLRFFVGTPLRFLWTAIGVVCLLMVVTIRPGLLQRTTEQLMAEIGGPILLLLIVFAGLKIIAGIGRGRKK